MSTNKSGEEGTPSSGPNRIRTTNKEIYNTKSRQKYNLYGDKM